MTNKEPGDGQKPKKRAPIRVDELLEKSRRDITKIAEKNGLTYDRYNTVKDEIKGRIPRTCSDEEAAAVKAVDDEILALAKSSTSRMNEMFSIQTGFQDLAKSMSENAARPWKEASQNALRNVGFFDSSNSSGIKENLVTPNISRPTIDYPPLKNFHPEPLVPISRQIVDGLAEARKEDAQRHEETAQATVAMAKLMEAQVDLTRQQMLANIENDKFNKKVLIWTLAVGCLTLVATIAGIVVSSL